MTKKSPPLRIALLAGFQLLEGVLTILGGVALGLLGTLGRDVNIK